MSADNYLPEISGIARARDRQSNAPSKRATLALTVKGQIKKWLGGEGYPYRWVTMKTGMPLHTVKAILSDGQSWADGPYPKTILKLEKIPGLPHDIRTNLKILRDMTAICYPDGDYPT